MSKSKPSLAAAIHNIQPAKPVSVVTTVQDTGERPQEKKTPLVLPAEAHLQLKRLAVDSNRTLRDLMGEAVNDLFVKYKLPPIA
jgi:hypothetical protein